MKGGPHAWYYFNVINGHFTRDTEGSELPGLDSARREALMRMGEILHERGKKALGLEWLTDEWLMVVLDSSGQCVFKLHLTADEQGIKAGEPAFEEAQTEARLRGRYSTA